MKMIGLLVAAASLAMLVGCGSDVGDGSNPAHPENTQADKAPSPDLAQVNGGGSDAVIAVPATALSNTGGGGGPAGGSNPGVRPHTQQ